MSAISALSGATNPLSALSITTPTAAANDPSAIGSTTGAADGASGGGSASASTATTSSSVTNPDGTTTITVTNAQGVIQSVSTTGTPDSNSGSAGGNSSPGSRFNLKA
ncbi:MAG TPA: hypothetical protein VFE10_12660 [Phenylobacterium sp.]|jgi:hypothetical protein|nr:hypothetical protein [Phenylobacterium sp.]